MKKKLRENKTGCDLFPEHKVDFYKSEYRDLMYYLTNTICHFHNAYYDWSPHIFHRELAETISTFIEDNYNQKTKSKGK